MTIAIWLSSVPPGHCTLNPTRVPKPRDLNNGLSVASTFPSDVSYRMSDRFPDDLLLSDNFKVAAQVLVSEALQLRLVSALPEHRLEFLPVSIINHKGRVASDRYFILHPLDVVDCIDIKKSKVSWNPLNKTEVMSSKGLVIDENAVPENLRMFRPRHWGGYIMLRPSLADELGEAGFSGLRFIPATGFTGIG